MQYQLLDNKVYIFILGWLSIEHICADWLNRDWLCYTQQTGVFNHYCINIIITIKYTTNFNFILIVLLYLHPPYSLDIAFFDNYLMPKALAHAWVQMCMRSENRDDNYKLILVLLVQIKIVVSYKTRSNHWQQVLI